MYENHSDDIIEAMLIVADSERKRLTKLVLDLKEIQEVRQREARDEHKIIESETI